MTMGSVVNDGGVCISPLSRRTVECVGPHFITYWQAQPSEDGEYNLNDENDLEDDNSCDSMFDEDDVEFLRTLDPKAWKEQDHYAVLGLKKLRFKATEDNIKKAYRLKVLKHHPDKRKGAGEEIRPDDDYFTCITKAWEILGNPRTRQSYDSVDPMFNDSIPSVTENAKKNFFQIFGEVFERNAVWSERKPVPKLGNVDSAPQEVQKFYDFWYNFQSWREFSYLDEEEKDKGSDREERRWIEKQNKAVRMKRKKEEMSRIRNIVDVAYSIDPRIQKLKQEEVNKKNAIKKARVEAAKARKEEEERLARETKERALQAEAELKAKEEASKAEKLAMAKALNKERSLFRKHMKTNNYYCINDGEMIDNMQSMEKICQSFQLNELTKLIENLSVNGRTAYEAAVKEVNARIEKERQAMFESTMRGSSDSSGQKCSIPWSQEQLQMLIKAVNVFPAGTNQRWEVVANFINQHNSSDGVIRTAKEVLAKAKDLQSSDYSQSALKVVANKNAYNNFERDQKSNISVTAAASQRFDGPGDLQPSLPWTSEEQKYFEQALKTFPTGTPERWDRIAECVPTRTKTECKKRFKEIFEMVKAKKAAQNAIKKP